MLKAIESSLSERLFCKIYRMNKICKGDIEAPQIGPDVASIAHECKNQHLEQVEGRTSGGQPQQVEDDWGRR